MIEAPPVLNGLVLFLVLAPIAPDFEERKVPLVSSWFLGAFGLTLGILPELFAIPVPLISGSSICVRKSD